MWNIKRTITGSNDVEAACPRKTWSDGGKYNMRRNKINWQSTNQDSP